MKHTSQTDTGWHGYLATLPADTKQHGLSYAVWGFADTPEAAPKSTISSV